MVNRSALSALAYDILERHRGHTEPPASFRRAVLEDVFEDEAVCELIRIHWYSWLDLIRSTAPRLDVSVVWVVPTDYDAVARTILARDSFECVEGFRLRDYIENQTFVFRQLHALTGVGTLLEVDHEVTRTLVDALADQVATARRCLPAAAVSSPSPPVVSRGGGRRLPRDGTTATTLVAAAVVAVAVCAVIAVAAFVVGVVGVHAGRFSCCFQTAEEESGSPPGSPVTQPLRRPPLQVRLSRQQHHHRHRGSTTTTTTTTNDTDTSGSDTAAAAASVEPPATVPRRQTRRLLPTVPGATRESAKPTS